MNIKIKEHHIINMEVDKHYVDSNNDVWYCEALLNEAIPFLQSKVFVLKRLCKKDGNLRIVFTSYEPGEGIYLVKEYKGEDDELKA